MSTLSDRISTAITVVALVFLAVMAGFLRFERGRAELVSGIAPGMTARPALLDPEASASARRVILGLAAGKVPASDAFQRPSVYADPPLLATLLAVGAIVSSRGSGDEDIGGVDENELEAMLWMAGPVLGAFGVLCVFFALSNLTATRKRGAFFGAAVYAFAPPIVDAQAGGYLAHHALGVPLLFLALGAARIAATRRDEGGAQGANRHGTIERRLRLDSLFAALACGVFGGLASLTFGLGLPLSLALILGLAARQSGPAWIAAVSWLLIVSSMLLDGPWESLLDLQLRADVDLARVLLPLVLLPLLFGSRWVSGRVSTRVRVASGLTIAVMLFALALFIVRGPAVLYAAHDSVGRSSAFELLALLPWFGLVAVSFVSVGRSTIAAFLVATILALISAEGQGERAGQIAILLPIGSAGLACLRRKLWALSLLVLGGSLSALRPVVERGDSTSVEQIAFLRDLRRDLPSPGPWNASQSTPDYWIACSPGLSALVNFHSRRPAWAATPDEALGDPPTQFLLCTRRDASRLGQMGNPDWVEIRADAAWKLVLFVRR